jgi:hypothetical protein
MTGRQWIGCGVVLAASLWASAAYGQSGYGLGFFDYGWGYGINYRQPPYYAMFPPVYYSYPVPRPYGYSPFAYPPGTVTPDIPPQAAAAEYINPYVSPSPGLPVKSEDKTAQAGRMYYNPFVKQAVAASTGSPAAGLR